MQKMTDYEAMKFGFWFAVGFFTNLWLCSVFATLLKFIFSWE